MPCYSVVKDDIQGLPVSTGKTGKAAQVLLLPADILKKFFNEDVYVNILPQQPNNAETGTREEEAINPGGGGGDAATEGQQEGIAEDEREDIMNDEVMEDAEMQDAEMLGEQQESAETDDSVFNVSTGCLAWMMKDVAVANEAAGDTTELPQEGNDAGGSLINTSQHRDSDSDESHLDSGQ